MAYGASIGMTALATVVATAIDAWRPIPNLSLIFVLPVVISAVSFGWAPALASAIAAILAYNYFLIDPRFSLRVADPANVLALVLLLAIATVVSAVADQSRRRAVAARKAADQEGALHGFARSLMGASDTNAIAQASAEALSRLFGAPAVVLVETRGQLRPTASAGEGGLSPADEEAARWAVASRLPTRGGAYPMPDAAYDFWPVVTRQRRAAALGVRISGADEGRPAEPERLVEIVGGYLSVALDREAYAAEVMDARLQVESERLKTDLLAAVSHDLKTPLSTILLTLQSLRKFGDAHGPAAQSELLALAEAETARLSSMVGNLLDVHRLEAGALAVHTEPAPLAELVEAAVAHVGFGTRVNARLGSAPTVSADPVLFETALINVLENAAKYAPAGSPIEVSTGADDRFGWVEVRDVGPGFAGAVEPMFAKFARGVEGDGRPPGTGLGLSIARGFMEAQGGRVEAGNREDGGGARVRLYVPLASLPAAAQ